MSTKEVNSLVHLSAGAAGGFVGVIVTSPLELLKTRQQSTVSNYSASSVTTGSGAVRHQAAAGNLEGAIWRQYRAIIGREGFRSLFKGLTPSVAAVVSSKGLFFLANSECRKHVRNFCSQGHVVHLTSGTLAGVINAFAMNPFWVIKTKLQLDERKCSRSAVWKTAKEMWRADRHKAFFRGASASLVGSFEFGLYFMIYEELKVKSLGRSFLAPFFTDTSSIPNMIHLGLSASISKIISNTILYPTEVVRTRLREDLETPAKQRKYTKLWRTCELIYKEEGARGLYGGWVLHLYKTIPFTIITFLVYEGLLDKFRESSHQKY